MTAQQFADHHGGELMVVTGPDRGQCTAVSHAWEKELGLPIVFGDAKDTFANAGPQYDRVSYKPGVVPIPGDIPVWNGNWGAGKGHTGLIVSATPAVMVVFNQNNPTGSLAHTQQIGYSSDLIGFIRPKGAQVMDREAVNLAVLNAYDRQANDVEYQGFVGQPPNVVLQALFNSVEHRTFVQTYYLGLQAKTGTHAVTVDGSDYIKK